MPEFAEVHTHVCWLRARVDDASVEAYGVSSGQHFPELKGSPERAATLKKFLVGATLQAVTQRGKFVVLRLSSGTLLAHLMFQGRFSLVGDVFTSKYKHHQDPPEDSSVGFWLQVGGRRWNFHDPEYKARVHAFPGALPAAVGALQELGPDILQTPETDPDYRVPWSPEDLVRAASRSRGAIKVLLLDQKKQAGIGNMYACESLYRAGIHPEKPSNSLTADQVRRLHGAVQGVVGEALASGLDYARVLKVYKRPRDPDGRAVRCTQVSGRDTYWVPEAQP
jgi:formamidopyrimidine-DNA glycosylase